MFFHKAMMTEIKMLAGNTNSAFFPILFIKYNSNNSSRKTSRKPNVAKDPRFNGMADYVGIPNSSPYPKPFN